MRYIEDLREDMVINEVYFCRKKQELTTKAGKPYFSLTLQDKTGNLDGKVWNVMSGGIDEFSSLDYINVSGRVTSFQGNLQMNISRVRISDEGEYDPADYVPCTNKDVGEMFSRILWQVCRTNICEKFWKCILWKIKSLSMHLRNIRQRRVFIMDSWADFWSIRSASRTCASILRSIIQ